MRVTIEAVIGADTGSLAAPRSLLLGRYDPTGRLQYVGRSTTLSRAAGRAVADQLTPPQDVHPWTGWTFSAGWGTQRTLDTVLVQPDVVMEVDVDVARDSAGRWRHPARPHRIRANIDIQEVPGGRRENDMALRHSCQQRVSTTRQHRRPGHRIDAADAQTTTFNRRSPADHQPCTTASADDGSGAEP
ncbi:hypothetical protein ACFYYV_49930, partial [Streptomyces sp. NPDC001978]